MSVSVKRVEFLERRECACLSYIKSSFYKLTKVEGLLVEDVVQSIFCIIFNYFIQKYVHAFCNITLANFMHACPLVYLYIYIYVYTYMYRNVK